MRPTVMPSHAVLLTDVHVGCTPFADFMRIGGTMEFSGDVLSPFSPDRFRGGALRRRSA